MTLRPAVPADAPAVKALLVAHGLTLEGVPGDLAGFVVAETEAGEIGGVAGLERYEGVALLRSVAVAVPGQGIGVALVRHLLAQADRERRVVVLLTESAEGYFPRFGFSEITRDEVPAAALASAEFCGACQESAVVMGRPLYARERAW